MRAWYQEGALCQGALPSHSLLGVLGSEQVSGDSCSREQSEEKVAAPLPDLLGWQGNERRCSPLPGQ